MTFIEGELWARKSIEDVIPNIKNHYRVTQEYKLLADFITRQLIEHVLEYLDKLDSTAKILKSADKFPTASIGQRNDAPIIFSALKNHADKLASNEIDKVLNYWKNIVVEVSPYLEDLKFFKEKLRDHNWVDIDQKLGEDEIRVLKKLKLSNNSIR